ncbi:MAG: sugar ABC transporter substrate-binding protein [Mesorhizobium sp.]|uniref:ABC transporter substrate-binding protein n=1 Tax=Mesorhizobium sp. TaxID=1871066 RepID=UPI00120C7AB4|nr:sugar ABC transporter substrate-binding protein [Mesorhizobium sp.]TIR48668.1 MAG: sugar ABC transporter substrate-binding protein [Mesorhizobium sp.]
MKGSTIKGAARAILAGLITASCAYLPAFAGEVSWPSFMWQDPGSAPALQKLKKTFEADDDANKINDAFVPISVFWEKQLSDVINGNAPDIVTLYDTDVRAYIERGLLEPLDEQLKAAGFNSTDLVPSRKLAEKGGKLYAVPWVTNARALFYNEKLFNDAGLKPPTNVDEFYAAAKALTDPEARQFGFALPAKPGSGNTMYIEIMPLIAGFGGGFFKDGKPSADSPETIAALKLYQRLYAENLIPRGVDLVNYRNMFAQGKIGMYASGSFMASVTANANPEVYKNLRAEVLPFPGHQTISVNVFFGIPKTAKNKELAAKVLMRMLSDDMQLKIAQAGKAHPGRKDVLPASFFDQNPWFKAFQEATQTAKSYAPEGAEQYGDEIVKIVTANIEAMLFNNVSPEETAARIQTALTDFMATKK